MSEGVGRVGDADQALVNQAPAGLGPTGFDPSRITALLDGISGAALEPIIRKASDEFYCTTLDAAKQWLLENLDYNLKSHVECLERENQRMRTELYEVDRAFGEPWMTNEARLERIRITLAEAGA